jgi:Ca-activated chloride channel homolog
MRAAVFLTLTFLASAACAQQARLDLRLSEPVTLAGQKNTVFVKVGLTGFALDKKKDRGSVNVAIVLDKSGSMSGDKMRKAKEAARLAVDRLGPNDIVSIVAYDSVVRVLVPATKATDKRAIRQGIDRISAGGNTALFAGVSKAADELRKFLDRNRVNRVILMSDGLANVGPSNPADLQSLGRTLAGEGMSVTTIGLGLDYNEDLMAKLASASDGNHVFAERPDDLTRFFALEFGDVLSVVAQDVHVRLKCAPGVRPVRALGREADIVGQVVTARLNQLISKREKFLLVEVELPPGEVGGERDVVTAEVTYANLATESTDRLQATVRARFTDSRAEVIERQDKDVMVKAVEHQATERNRMAVILNDQGRQKEAEKMLQDNAAFLNKNWSLYKAPSLKNLEETNREDARNMSPDKYRKRRKNMRRVQHSVDFQQSY